MENEITLLDAMHKLHGKKLGKHEYRIAKEGLPSWLSGSPYTWTSFFERAFVFGSRADANRLIKQFPKELKGCLVQVTPTSPR